MLEAEQEKLKREKVFHHYNMALLGCAAQVTGFYSLRLLGDSKSERANKPMQNNEI